MRESYGACVRRRVPRHRRARPERSRRGSGRRAAGCRGGLEPVDASQLDSGLRRVDLVAALIADHDLRHGGNFRASPLGGARVVAAEARQQQRHDRHRDDAEHAARDDRRAHARQRRDEPGLDVAERRAGRVRELLDAGQASAQPVGDRLVPDRAAEDAAQHVREARRTTSPTQASTTPGASAADDDAGAPAGRGER